MQHRGAGTVPNTSLMRPAMTTLPSDDLHNVFLADRSEAVPDKKNITVGGVLGKN